MAYNDARGELRGEAGTVLLTRPRAQSEAFATILTQRFAQLDIVIAPLIEIVPMGDPGDLGDLGEVAGVIFSSMNAVAHAGPGRDLPAYCVGAQTTDAARAAGFAAICEGRTADELVAALTASRPAGPLLHLHGRHQRGDIAGRLAQAGLTVRGRVIYDQAAVPPGTAFQTALARRPLIAPLFSPRTATLFAEASGTHWGNAVPDRVHLIALSAAVAEALPPEWRDGTDIAPTPDRGGMLDGIARRVYP